MNKPKIHDKINEIAQVISLVENDTSTMGLLGGMCGNLLFKAQYNKLVDAQFFDIGQDVQYIFDNINEVDSTLFSSGLAGIGFTLLQLIEGGFLDADKTILEDLNEILEVQLFQKIEEEDYDYLHGAIGIALYFLKYGGQQEVLSKAIKLIEQKGVETQNSVYWLASRYLNSADNAVNFSLAHGLNSFILFFCQCSEQNIEKETCHRLALKTLNYIQQYKFVTPIKHSCYPSTNSEAGKLHASRLAWCYGDMGVAVSLYKLGKVLSREDFINESINLLELNSNRKTQDETNVVDAGICHGAAGIAHIYNRFYLETKNPLLKSTADFWLEETLKFATHPDGLAGYKSWQGEDEKHINVEGFLEGVSGIGLVLIGCLTADISDLSWDSCLLLS